MGKQQIPLQLTKSYFMAGEQCDKRLYLEIFLHEEEKGVEDAVDQAVIESGHRIGKLAQQLFPDGVLIEPDYDDPDAAVRRTALMMQDLSVPAIFEATFSNGREGLRVDILQRVGENEWNLIEVKASSEVKPQHLRDLAFQLYVLRGEGVNVRRAYVVHPNKEYLYHGEISPSEFFAWEEVTDQVEEELLSVPASLPVKYDILDGRVIPEVEPGGHCNKPVRCPFFDRCNQVQTPHPIKHIPSLSSKARNNLAALNIKDITEIDQEVAATVLTARQRRVWKAVTEKKPYFDVDGLEKALSVIVHPVSFIDFEAFQPAIPLYEGTRPYQRIPFQWSNHILTSAGRVYHKEYLHGDDTDPRARFIKRLLNSLKGGGSVVVFSPYEKAVLTELQREYPELEAEIEQVKDRIVDLLPIVRNNIYYPEQNGSYSIKYLGPALVPGFTYDDLQIRDGMQAAIAFEEIIKPDTDVVRRAELSTSLLRYCGRDTEILLKIYLALRREIELRRSHQPAALSVDRKLTTKRKPRSRSR